MAGVIVSVNVPIEMLRGLDILEATGFYGEGRASVLLSLAESRLDELVRRWKRFPNRR